MTAMATSYYIYYKVPPEREAQLKPAVEELQRLLAARTGVKGRLLCRRDKPETWMEVYEPVAEDTEFLATLEAELERVRFAELLGTDVPRHTEIFRPR